MYLYPKTICKTEWICDKILTESHSICVNRTYFKNWTLQEEAERMKLNIQIIAEDFLEYSPIQYCRTERLIRMLEYPMLYTGEETLCENVLYVADAGMCPDLGGESACYNFLLAGKLQRDLLTMNCNLCVIPENVTVIGLFNKVVKLFFHYQSWENDLLSAISQELPLSALGELSVPVLRRPLGLVDC